MSLPLVTPARYQSSAFSFELLEFLLALSQTERIFHFEVGRAVGYRGKIVRVFFFGNFSSIETIRSLFQVSENAKVVPQNCSLYSSLYLRTLLQKQGIGQIVYLLPKLASLKMAQSNFGVFSWILIRTNFLLIYVKSTYYNFIKLNFFLNLSNLTF